MADILVIAGLSGAGRSQAADDLEDLGWFVVDNLPVSLIDKVVELSESAAAPQNRLALVVGVASHQNDAIASVERLRQAGNRVRILYMDAATPELIRRYGASKRRHPMAIEGETVERSIERERHLLEPVKAAADLVIDTTTLTVHQLKNQIVELFWDSEGREVLQLSVMSFGYKHGIPLDVDFVFDVRFLPELATTFVTQVEGLLELLLPAFREEGKSYLTVAVGCTGGRHRSVAVAEELSRWLTKSGYRPRVTHRDVHRS
ncbi:MAG: RNase adaptor protein RapZ [Actinobacteria bacterium]|nr:RNase adaptor protein RapZ [Actinomycetota bacterium]